MGKHEKPPSREKVVIDDLRDTSSVDKLHPPEKEGHSRVEPKKE